jgi:hypothetical protein
MYQDNIVLNSRLVAIVPNISLSGKLFRCVAVCHDKAQSSIVFLFLSCHPPEQISWWRQALRYGETFGLISGLTW